MDDAATFLSESLNELGVDGKVHENVHSLDYGTELYVTKRIGAERLTYTVRLSPEALTRSSDDEIRKQLAMYAKEIKSRFEQAMTESFDWDDRKVITSVYDGGWAECRRCGERVQSPHTSYIAHSSDSSSAMPVTRAMGYELDRMGELKQEIFKMYLIGRLRYRCKPSCPNSIDNRKI